MENFDNFIEPNMEINERRIDSIDYFQERAQRLAIYRKGNETDLVYSVLGLNGEAGEIAEHIKKMIRDDNGILSEERRQKLIKELSDQMWYISAVATDLGVKLSEICYINIEKLEDRKNRGVLKGSGSDR